MNPSDKNFKLDQIEANIRVCKKCGLCEHAKNAVPGEGNRDADIVFIGEAPGAYEDATGRPFVGRAGKLLDKALAVIGLERSNVWIGNIIKHRPPNNRDPLPAEISACSPYLALQLQLIRPKLVVTLGRFAMNHFYADGKISRDHGRLIVSGGYNVFPVYHPAAALRNGSMMVSFMNDFKRIPAILKDIKEGNLSSFDSSKGESPDVPDGQLGLGV